MRGWRRGMAAAGMAAILLETGVVGAIAVEQHLTIAAVGDIMMGSNYPYDALPPDGGAGLFGASEPILQRADVAFGNLEGRSPPAGRQPRT